MNGSRARRHLAATVRVGAALVALVVLMVGVPASLALLVGNPLPDAVPTWTEVTRAVDRGRIEPLTQARVLAVVAWVTWANLAVSFAVEGVAVVRGRRARARRSLLATQWLAARVVGHLALVGSLSLDTSAAGGAVLPPLPVAVAAPELPGDEPAPEAVDDPAPGGEIRARRRDTLWSMAERHLGSGQAWRALRDVNVGRTMADGTVLGEGFTSVRPGWVLVLPGDDPLPASAAGPGAGLGAAVAQVEVVRGDNLWDLSEERLDDARLPSGPSDVLAYLGDVIDRNGDRIDDPDLIFPGQVFDFPTPGQPSEHRGPDDLRAEAEAEADTQVAPGFGPDADRGQAEDGEVAGFEGVPASLEDVARPGSETGEPGSVGRIVDADPGVRSGAGGGVRPVVADTGTIRQSALGSPLAHLGSVTFGAAAALLASGGLRALARRRRYRLAHRRPGTVPAPPDPELHQIERALHRHRDEEATAWLAAAVDSLSARPIHHGEQVAQPVAARLDREALEVVFDHADPMAAPLPWASLDGGRTWRIPAATAVTDLPPPAVDNPAPTLVTVGVDHFLNLEAAGVVALVGEGREPFDLVRSVVHELATGPAAGLVDIRSTVLLAGTDSYGLVRYQPARALGDELASWLDTVADRLDGHEVANAYALRLVAVDDPPGPVVVVLAAEDLDEVRALVDRVRHRRFPVVVLVLGPTEHADQVIEVGPDQAVLGADPAWSFEPQLLGERAATALGRLLADAADAPYLPMVPGVELSAPAAARPPDHHLEDRPGDDAVYGDGVEGEVGGEIEGELGVEVGGELGGEVEGGREDGFGGEVRFGVGDEREAGSTVDLGAAGGPGAEGPPRPVEALRRQDIEAEEQGDVAIVVGVLGPVTIDGVDAELTSQQLSVLTYLACHGPVSRAMLIDALWDGQVISRSRLPNLLTELRARVGRHHLPEAREGRYALDGADTDLARFERGVRRAQTLSGRAAAAELRSALQLVRGVPLTPPSRRFWSWVTDESHLAARVEAVVADSALRLAALERADGDLDGAEWACQQGLLASPTDEALVVALTEIYVDRGQSGLARRLVEGWEDRIGRLDCGEPSDEPRRRLHRPADH